MAMTETQDGDGGGEGMVPWRGRRYRLESYIHVFVFLLYFVFTGRMMGEETKERDVYAKRPYALILL
jgi:hypothetical protein